MKPASLIAALILASVPFMPTALWAQATPVSVAKAGKGAIEQVYHGLARVRPLLEARASGQFDGRIVQVFAQVGEKVKVGQPLARLSPKSVELGNSSLVLGGAGYTVVANVAGVIVAQTQNLGDVISAGTSIFTIVPESGFRISLSVPLQYAGDIGYDSAATLHLADGDIATTPSSVQPFDLTGTGFFPVEFAVTKGAPVLGSVLAADIVVRRNDAALLIPERAIVEKNGAFYVFVVSGGKAVQTEVKLGIRAPGKVEVLSGLKEGDEVVTVGNYALEDGVEVKVVKGG